MSEQGLKAAANFGESLPQFSSQVEAERLLLSKKDETLKEFLALVPRQLKPDFSLESLKRLENWYFNADKPQEVSGLSIPLGLGFYLGEVMCRNGDYKWVVNEFVFKKGTYEIGITRGLETIMLTNGRMPELTNNKRRHSLFRYAKSWIE